MEFSIGENTKVSELLRSDDYIDRGHPKVKPKKKLTHTEKKPKSVIETKVKMKGLTIKEILLSKVRDAVPKGTIVERLMYESKTRTEEDIAKDLDENFIPKLKVFAYGGMTPKAMAKFLSDSDKCPEWFNKFGWFKNQIDKYVNNYKYLSDSERRDMWYKMHESARDMLSALDKNGFYAIMKRHKSKMRVIEEMVTHCYYLAYGKDALVYIGCALLKDEVRVDAKEGLSLIKSSGVQTIMITGDSLDTALYIANELDMLNDNDVYLTSSDLELMSDDDVKNIFYPQVLLLC